MDWTTTTRLYYLTRMRQDVSHATCSPHFSKMSYRRFPIAY